MKIIQILPRIEGCGITRFVCEMNTALKAIGVDVTVATFLSDSKSVDMKMRYGSSVPGIVVWGYSDDVISEINSADFVFIHSLMDAKTDEKYRNSFKDLIINKITAKKVLFVNDRKMMSIRTYYGDWTIDEDFVKSIDFFCMFTSNTPVYNILKERYGLDILKKYIHLGHPYTFDERKLLWKPFEKKYKRVTYLGRFATFKDPCRLIRAKEYFDAGGFQCELRGIARCIATAFQQDLFNHLDEKGNKLGLSEKTLDISPAYKKRNHIIDDMVDVTDRNNKIYVFREYQREEGIKAISSSMFGANFYRLLSDDEYGDSIEYSIAEMVDAGTIPVMDWDMGHAVHLCKDGRATKDTIYDKDMGIFIKKDLSNINEAIDKLNAICADAKCYNTYRNRCFKLYQQHFDPKSVAQCLIDDLVSHSNNDDAAQVDFDIERKHNKCLVADPLF